MNIEVKALGPVAHGRVNAKRGDTFPVSKGEAQELEKKGLVEIVGESQHAEQEPVATEVAEKMAAPVENKMVKATRTK